MAKSGKYPTIREIWPKDCASRKIAAALRAKLNRCAYLASCRHVGCLSNRTMHLSHVCCEVHHFILSGIVQNLKTNAQVGPALSKMQKVCLIRRNFTRHVYFQLSGTHLYTGIMELVFCLTPSHGTPAFVLELMKKCANACVGCGHAPFLLFWQQEKSDPLPVITWTRSENAITRINCNLHGSSSFCWNTETNFFFLCNLESV